ncbi:MAG: DUF1810 domain-containing protein [Pseudomonas formosensis]|nr:DUF1810 domain-containing protein [Halopseudomonas formosensis]
MQDSFDLERFHAAQQHQYAAALDEIRGGRKRSHWIWFVFPQLKGLGRSATAARYGLSGLAEARAYLADPVLGGRLRESVSAMLELGVPNAEAVLGPLDALKFRSCLTLFALADPQESLFGEALQHFFASERDGQTLKLLGCQPPANND